MRFIQIKQILRSNVGSLGATIILGTILGYGVFQFLAKRQERKSPPSASEVPAAGGFSTILEDQLHDHLLITTANPSQWPYLGNVTAKVHITEFIDYECTHCRDMHALNLQLEKKLTNNVAFVFRDFPNDPSCNPYAAKAQDKNACKAAYFARCAHNAGQFKEAHGYLLTKNSDFSGDYFDRAIKSLNLNAADMYQCMQSKEVHAAIAKDIEVAAKLGITSTPSLYFKGRRYLGKHDINSITYTVRNLLAQ